MSDQTPPPGAPGGWPGPPPPSPPPPPGQGPPGYGYAPPGYGYPPPGYGYPPPGYGYPPPGYPPPGYPAPGYNYAAPGSGRFRARSFSELIDAVFTIYRRNFALIVSIAACAQVPFAVLQVIVYAMLPGNFATAGSNPFAPTTTNNIDTNAAFTYLGVTLIFAMLQFLVVQLLATAAITRAVSERYLDRQLSLGDAYRAALRRAGALVLLSLLLLGLVLGAYAVIVVVAIIFALIAGPLGLLVLLPLGFGGIVLAGFVYARWSLAVPIVVLEKQGPVTALRRSNFLVKGDTGRVFLILIVIVIITAIVNGIVGVALGIPAAFASGVVALILRQLASVVGTVLVGPITYITVVVLYYDVRIRREAFDLEMLAQSL